MEIKRAGDMVGTGADFISVVLYGDTGSGKTTAGAVLDKVLIILTEPNGLKSILAINPNADVVMPKTFKEVRDACNLVHTELASAASEGREPRWKWVVLDSFTDMQILLKREILDSSKGTKKSHDSLTLDEWGIIGDRSHEFIRKFRDLEGINRLVICLLALIDDDKGAVDSDGQKLRAPMLLGRSFSPNRMASMFNVAGLMFKGKKSGEFRALTRAGSQFVCKGHPNVPPITTPRLDDWARLLAQPVDPAVFSQEYGGLLGIPEAVVEEAIDATADPKNLPMNAPEKSKGKKALALPTEKGENSSKPAIAAEVKK